MINGIFDADFNQHPGRQPQQRGHGRIWTHEREPAVMLLASWAVVDRDHEHERSQQGCFFIFIFFIFVFYKNIFSI